METSFKAPLLLPNIVDSNPPWAFIVLPKVASDKLPRRGRITVGGTINGHPFQKTLDPDGQLSHWLMVDTAMQEAVSVKPGDTVLVEIIPLDQEPEPEVPSDLEAGLKANTDARRTWNGTTTIARLDWIHWIVSAKQEKTRKKRVNDACKMLSEGKNRVCCFDSSGFYSKSLSAPKARA